VILEKIGQFDRNQHLETTTRARLNPKDIDACIRIVKETASKNSQTVRWWYISRGGRVTAGPDTGKFFRRVSRGKLSAISMKAIIVILDLLHRVEMLHICGGKEGSTYWSKRMCLHWDSFGNFYITMHVHIWNLHIL
jgi:hypothetical protein